jgi:hypothetical protein
MQSSLVQSMSTAQTRKVLSSSQASRPQPSMFRMSTTVALERPPLHQSTLLMALEMRAEAFHAKNIFPDIASVKVFATPPYRQC